MNKTVDRCDALALAYSGFAQGVAEGFAIETME
jgi:hypothetical protein